MNIGDVTALTDTRDNNTYAVAKLADGNCWMIENLRLGSSTSIVLTTQNTQSAGTLPAATSTFGSENRGQYLNIQNTNSPVSNMTSTNSNVYSYGNYYSWATILNSVSLAANTSGYVSNSSICPAGWYLPYMFSSDSNDSSYQNGSLPSSANGWYAYPYNFLKSGYISSSSVISRGFSGYYWSNTASGSIGANQSASYLYLYQYSIDYSSRTYKNDGLTARCLTR